MLLAAPPRDIKLTMPVKRTAPPPGRDYDNRYANRR
jgi:hypothetical protein